MKFIQAKSAVLFLVLAFFCIPAHAQTYVSGQTYYGRNQYIEYKCGNYPLIISGPHAGTLSPAEIQDRTCGATDNDVNTNETILAMRDSFYAKTGKLPHVIINHLKRIKLDPNREVNEATCGDSVALISYNEYHAFIDSAKAMVLRGYGKGLYNDFHGHGHSIQRVEIGYVLSSDELAQPDASLDSVYYINQSSVKHLAGIVPVSFSQLIRGPKSLGNFLEDLGYPAVPSPSQPNPGTAAYYNGGYSVIAHGSMHGGTIDGIQFEVNYSGIRDNDANRKAFASAYAKIMDRFIQVYYFGAPDTTTVADSVISNGNGNWSAPSTWAGGIPPSSTKNVLIRAGDTVTVDVNTAQCKDIWFGSADSKLIMADASVLNVYGDFSLFSTTHNAFLSWAPGAKIRFAGNLIQMLKGWATSGASTSFKEMIVDKGGMKLTTYGNNMKFCLGDSLDIVSGTFELAGTDDLEGRTILGATSAPAIIVRSAGIFTMVGGGTTTTGTYIRQGSNTGPDDSKIGRLTVYGEVDFGSSNTSVRTNFSGIDIENGGAVYIPASRSIGAASFNPGAIVIKSGGLFKSSISTAYWYTNTATPNTVTVNAGGEYYSAAGTTNLPQSITLNTGSTVRYYSTTASTLPAGIAAYENLILTGTSAKSLGVNTTVNGTLTIQSTASLNLNGKTLTYGPAATLQYGYSSQTDAQTTTDNELPAAGGPQNVTIYNAGNVTLHAGRTVNGALKLTSGSLLTGTNTITLGSSALLTGENATRSVVGNLATTRSLGTTASSFGNIGVSITAGADNLGNVTVTRISGPTGIVTVNGNTGIARKWQIVSDNPPVSGREVTFAWTAGDDNGKDLSAAIVYKSGDGIVWNSVGTVRNAALRSIAVTTNSFSYWTVSDASSPLPVELASFAISVSGTSACLKWTTASEINSSLFTVERSGANNEWTAAGTIKAAGTSSTVMSYSFTDANLQPGTYKYRLKITDLNGSYKYSKTEEAVIGAPQVYSLSRNYPNPFNPTTAIEFGVPGKASVTLTVYNQLGEAVAVLVNGEMMPGYHRVDWNAASMTSGVYFYELRTEKFREIRKMLLLK